MGELEIIKPRLVHKFRLFMELAYDGSAYCGWQRQLNVPTVQQTIEDLLSKIYNEKITVMGCGRTDSGVHASMYYAHINVPEIKEYLMKALEGQLPKDIVVRKIVEVSPDAHARFDATERSYTYKLHSVKDPFLRNWSLYTPLNKLDIALIRKACSIFEQYDNYLQLCKFNPELKEHTSKVKKAQWIELNDGKNVEFHVSANRFLHNQIRRMVGCLLDIGKGNISLDDLEQAMTNNIALKYNTKVGPQGLFLSDIKYPYINL